MVIGPCGAGKSVFSRKLAKILNLPLYPLDNIFWNENKEHISRPEFDAKLEEILRKESWIIDGDYSRTYEIRMQNADTIIYLNFPLEVCLSGAQARVGTVREDCPFVEKEFDPVFRDWIIKWFTDTAPVVEELLEKYRDKNIIVFQSREEADSFLSEEFDEALYRV